VPLDDVAALAAQVRAGERSAVDVVEEHLERIRSGDRDVAAFVLVDDAAALREARRRDGEQARGAPCGPLHGVPFAVKDLIDVRGWPTRAHSWMLTDRGASGDAAIVAALRRAGAIPLGKLALQEFGIGADEDATPWPPARNPWDTERTAGGSSSGAGAAVAAGLVPLAVGTDTGGSVRLPAALCGVVGLKPTYGRVDVGGVIPLAPSLDHVGWLTRSAHDARLVLDAVTGDGRARAGQPAAPGGLRLGVLRHFFERDVVAGAETRAAIDAALGVLDGLGVHVVDVETRPAQVYRRCGATLLGFEAHAVHRHRLATAAGSYGAATRAALERGARVSLEQHAAADRERARLRADLAALMSDQEIDVLVTGVAPEPAWRIGDRAAARRAGDGAMRMAFNVLGLPALALPAGVGAGGLPLGFQIAARPGCDALVLDVARAFQEATSWHLRTPPRAPAVPSV
jgi:aspartyl-tRNA(Asn)/glutamyl-tRNA(Gln) amidotransferase subunit A